MNDFGGKTVWIGWKPGQRDIYWEREIINIKNNEIRNNGYGIASSYSTNNIISENQIFNIQMRILYNKTINRQK